MKSSSFIRPRVNFVGSLHSTQSQSLLLPDTVKSTTTATHRQKKKRKEGRWRAGKSATGKQLQHNFYYRLWMSFSFQSALHFQCTAQQWNWRGYRGYRPLCAYGEERRGQSVSGVKRFCFARHRMWKDREREKKVGKNHINDKSETLYSSSLLLLLFCIAGCMTDWLPACVCLLFFKNWPRQLFFFQQQQRWWWRSILWPVFVVHR